MTDNDIPNLRQMPAEEVNNLCERAEAACPHSYSVRVEADGFRRERTPWSATRLANALDIYDKTEAIAELVGEIDRAAEACAGCASPNRLSRRL